jgi:hypothetical protein
MPVTVAPKAPAVRQQPDEEGARQHEQRVVLVHPQDFRVAREVGHHIEIGVLVALAPDPADMRLEQAVLARRYRIVRPFDVLVVACGAPTPTTAGHADRTAMRSTASMNCTRARALEGAMREIAVVDRLDTEHAQRVAGGASSTSGQVGGYRKGVAIAAQNRTT